jgi:hypothetical protein
MLRKNVCRIILVTALILAPSVHSGDIKCFVLVPPEQTLSNVKQIAVLDLSGDEESGRVLTDFMISALLDADRGITEIKSGLFGSKREGVTHQKGARTNVFTVIERSRISAVLSEQQIGMTGIIDETQAASIGKILGVDAVIIGTVTPNIDEKSTREELNFYNSETKQWYKAMGTCIRRKVTISARIRIIDANTGQIIGTKEGARVSEDKKCEPQLEKLSSLAAMKDACLRTIGYEDLVNYFSPRFHLTEFDLEDIKIDQYKDIGKNVKNAAKDGNFDKAYLLYMSILKEDEYNDAAQYNIGVLEEIVGNFEEARAAYELATNLKPEKKFKEAMNRAMRSAAYWQRLSEMGVQLEKHAFEVSEKAMASATAAKVVLKGGSSDRIELRESANGTSAVVTKVPGGMEMEWLDSQGDWIQVKTIKGQIGFVSKKEVKTFIGKN